MIVTSHAAPLDAGEAHDLARPLHDVQPDTQLNDTSSIGSKQSPPPAHHSVSTAMNMATVTTALPALTSSLRPDSLTRDQPFHHSLFHAPAQHHCQLYSNSVPFPAQHYPFPPPAYMQPQHYYLPYPNVHSAYAPTSPAPQHHFLHQTPPHLRQHYQRSSYAQHMLYPHTGIAHLAPDSYIGIGGPHNASYGHSPNHPHTQSTSSVRHPNINHHTFHAERHANTSTQVRATSASTVPRGPPRKPKRSGPALWVGNLPSGTDIRDMKDHFSRDAMADIESVFLISKSNCAFVNYRTESACIAAVLRFHDSIFKSVRLVCRLRRDPTSAVVGPATASTTEESDVSNTTSRRPLVPTPVTGVSDAPPTSLLDADARVTKSSTGKLGDRFFILKSLTVEDMDLSVRDKIWATQAHNEKVLNEAYENHQNVFLFFSANKSGQYYGYARMTSLISEEAANGLDWAPRRGHSDDNWSPTRSIVTQATQFAPKGRIEDDSARDTIFWEADENLETMPGVATSFETGRIDSETSPTDSATDETDETDVDGEATIEAEPEEQEGQTFGRPFRLEWISTTPVPFHLTRGMRNAWNSNREVKIARDGTELESRLGKRLLLLFHQFG